MDFLVRKDASAIYQLPDRERKDMSRALFRAYCLRKLNRDSKICCRRACLEEKSDAYNS